jgi:hypothetical protein
LAASPPGLQSRRFNPQLRIQIQAKLRNLFLSRLPGLAGRKLCGLRFARLDALDRDNSV